MMAQPNFNLNAPILSKIRTIGSLLCKKICQSIFYYHQIVVPILLLVSYFHLISLQTPISNCNGEISKILWMLVFAPSKKAMENLQFRFANNIICIYKDVSTFFFSSILTCLSSHAIQIDKIKLCNKIST